MTPFRVLTHMVGIAIFSITAFLQGPASVTSESVSIAIRGAVEPVPAHGKFVLAYEVDIFNRASRESTVTSLEVFNGDGLSLLRYDKSNLKHNRKLTVSVLRVTIRFTLFAKGSYSPANAEWRILRSCP